MRNVYIINPKAGKHDHTVQFMERIRAVHATHGEEPEIYLTQRAGHGEELARAAAEKGDAVRIWAVGGDGTVLEVVRGAEFHKNAAVGVYPCGSGNDFVRSFGKREVFLNPENQLAGKTVSIDMIRTQHGDAVNICSVGFDAKVAAEMNYYKHLPFVSGELAYTISLAKCFLGHLADKMTVTFYYADGTKETVTGEFLFTLAGNGRWYGGGSCALNIRTRDSERIVPRNVESQHELTSFVSIIVHINRVDKRVDDTPLILNIFNITPLERFEPIHDSLLRQEGLFHFLPGNLPFEVSAFFFQLLKTFLRCWCDNALLYCGHEILDSLIGLLQSFL